MAYSLNEKISGLVPYEPISGDFRIRLDANESYLGLSDEMLNKISDSIKNIDFNRYPDPYAKKLVKLYADYYSISDENVTAGNGSDELIGLIISSFLMKGDKLLTLSPDFSMYAFYASIYENEVIALEKDKNFEIDIDTVIKKVNNENIKLVIFSNPCNPTGIGIKCDDVRKLASSVNALIVLDEAYMDFWNQSLLGEINSFDNLIILRTMSKAFGMAAVRLGFAVANKELTNVIRAVKAPYNVNTVTQTIASVLLSSPEEIQRAKEKLITAREQLYSMVNELQGEFPNILQVTSTVTNFVYIKTDYARYIFDELANMGISIRYMGQYIRITAGSDYENSEVIKCMKKCLQDVK